MSSHVTQHTSLECGTNMPFPSHPFQLSYYIKNKLLFPSQQEIETERGDEREGEREEERERERKGERGRGREREGEREREREIERERGREG